MLSVKPVDSSKRTSDQDEHTLELLTREMEHLVIENGLAIAPATSDLGRARSLVVKRVRDEPPQERPGPRRRTLSQRSIGASQLPSPVSPQLKAYGRRLDVEVIDVDALPDEDVQAKWQPMIRKGWGNNTSRLEASWTFPTYIRARSKSC
jgi:hypothetical protein